MFLVTNPFIKLITLNSGYLKIRKYKNTLSYFISLVLLGVSRKIKKCLSCIIKMRKSDSVSLNIPKLYNTCSFPSSDRFCVGPVKIQSFKVSYLIICFLLNFTFKHMWFPDLVYVPAHYISLSFGRPVQFAS